MPKFFKFMCLLYKQRNKSPAEEQQWRLWQLHLPPAHLHRLWVAQQSECPVIIVQKDRGAEWESVSPDLICRTCCYDSNTKFCTFTLLPSLPKPWTTTMIFQKATLASWLSLFSPSRLHLLVKKHTPTQTEQCAGMAALKRKTLATNVAAGPRRFLTALAAGPLLGTRLDSLDVGYSLIRLQFFV